MNSQFAYSSVGGAGGDKSGSLKGTLVRLEVGIIMIIMQSVYYLKDIYCRYVIISICDNYWSGVILMIPWPTLTPNIL